MLVGDIETNILMRMQTEVVEEVVRDATTESVITSYRLGNKVHAAVLPVLPVLQTSSRQGCLFDCACPLEPRKSAAARSGRFEHASASL